MKKYIFLFLATAFQQAFSQTIIIKNVTLIDVKTGKAIPAQSVVIHNERIEMIGAVKKIKEPANAVVIDGSGKFLMPGMTDAHIHFFQSGGLYTRPDVVDLRKKMPYEKEKAFGLNNAADYMHRYLRLGITSVIDVGGPFANFTIRDSVTKTTIAPNVLVTGPLFSIVEDDYFGEDKPIEKVTSEKEVDALFAKMLPYKPDFIKIWYIADNVNPPKTNFPLVKYIADQTHKNSLKLTVHATELLTAQLAVEAGADILVHSVSDEVIPDEFVKILKDQKITYIPTLIVGTNYFKALSGNLPHHQQDLAWANSFAYGSLTDPEAMDTTTMPPVLKMLRKIGVPHSKNKADSIAAINLVKLAKAGVNIASGTDAGNISTMHASSFIQELEAMQKAGLTNAEILKASTINAAIGFGKEQQWGSIEKGKMADMILLEKNPLESLQHLNSINSVFKNGKMMNIDSIVVESPEAIVQRQLNAYNARNIDAFMDTYADDIELYDFPGKLSSKGKEEMRKDYADFFKNVNNLYCEIENRIVIGNKIIDKEKVRAGKRTFHAVAVYEVEKGKIKRVTFIR
ncbi:MAG TPA: amidohydrolase family protein [Chitinophagaceae bacterium]|nr:amidohydrolase family protein [Chitinophagaceae bacterium]